MIILPEHKLVIVTPPKCGSTSLHTMFPGIHVVDAVRDKHTTIIPYHYRDFRVAIVVRNPYERARSLWMHWRQFVDEKCELPAFLHKLAYREIDDWFYADRLVDCASAIRWGSTGERRPVDVVIRLERLREDLRALGLYSTVPHENASKSNDVNWTVQLRYLSTLWFEDDFLRFGYDLWPNRSRLLERLPKGGVLAEIGVMRGIHAHEMLRICQPRNLVLVDCWREDVWPHRSDFEQQVRERFARDERVQIVKANSEDAAREFADEMFDAIYIDADHDETAVTRDLDAWWPKLKPNGIFCGHDYIDPPRPGNGVKAAVDGFCEPEGLRVCVEPDDGFPEWWVGK